MVDVPWEVIENDEAAARRLSEEAGVPVVVAQLLLNRGVSTSGEVEQFLNPSLAHLHDPSLLPDLDVGVERLAKAVESGEKICVHGDYDVDGVTSTALLVRTLRALNADVDYRLPHRKKEGYGIRTAAVEEIAGNGVGVIVTCDCGITACETVDRANELGIDVIVTDHHEPGPELPRAVAVINPKREDATYPFPELAGVGVAFKFAQGLVRKLGLNEESFQSRFIDLAALGTVGDVVPLVGENRTIVTHGLKAIPVSNKLGFQTMLKSTGLEGKPMTAYYLAFVLGPRINAVGRMDDASSALKLFLTRDEAEARTLMVEMERHNTERKVEQNRIFEEAVEQAESKDLSALRVLVLSSDSWNTGVVGIVASKIAEKYTRPAIIINRDDVSGFGHGSARSIDGFNMLEGLRHCHDLLAGYGGHTLAAGMSVQLDNLQAFEDKINEYALDMIPEEVLAPRVIAEVEINAADINRKLVDILALMEPFGMGNPEPLFITRNLNVLQRQRVGDGSHLRLQVQGKDASPISCIAFGMGDAADIIELGGSIDLCYSIRLNVYNGIESVQMIGKAIRLSS